MKQQTKKQLYKSVCCGAEVKYQPTISSNGSESVAICQKCHTPCSLTLTNAGVEASVVSNHSLSYPEAKQQTISESWVLEFDALASALDMDGEQTDEVRYFIRKLLQTARKDMVTEMEKMVGEDEEFGPVERDNMTFGDLRKETRNELREEIRQKLQSLLKQQ